MVNSGDRRVRRLHYMGWRAWLMLVAVLGLLLLGPVMSEFGPEGPGNRWMEAAIFSAGVIALVAIWRFLAKSFRCGRGGGLDPSVQGVGRAQASPSAGHK